MAVKNLRFFLITIVILMALSACTKKNTLNSIEDCYDIRTNYDLTYAYEITDLAGNVLLSDPAAFREPTIMPISDSVLEVSTQTGTGLSTNWAIYCDVETGQVSEKYNYVLGAEDGYVFSPNTSKVSIVLFAKTSLIPKNPHRNIG